MLRYVKDSNLSYVFIIWFIIGLDQFFILWNIIKEKWQRFPEYIK